MINEQIFIVTSHLYSGGIASISESYYKMYKDNGHKVTCIVLDGSNISERFTIDDNDLVKFKFNLIKNSGYKHTKKIKSLLSNMVDFSNFCKKNKGIYIYVHFDAILMSMLTSFSFRGSKKVYTIHTNIFEYLSTLNRWKKIILNKFISMLANSNALVFLTSDVSIEYKQKYKSENIVTSIPNITNIDAMLSDSKNKLGILFCGRLSIEKNAHLIIPVYEEYRNLGGVLPCTIVGDGPKKKFVELQISNSKYKNDINLLGHVDNVNNIYDECSFLTVLSKTEGFGLVIVEAISRCIPVISSNCRSGPSSILCYGEDVPFNSQKDSKFGRLLPILDENNLRIYALSFIDFEKRKRIDLNDADELVSRYSSKNIYKYWKSILSEIK